MSPGTKNTSITQVTCQFLEGGQKGAGGVVLGAAGVYICYVESSDHNNILIRIKINIIKKPLQ